MSASVIVSKDSILAMLWNSSLILACFSIFILMILVFRHVIIQHIKTKIETRKKELNKLLFVTINSPIELDLKSIPILSNSDYPILMRCALDIMRSLHGSDMIKIIKILNLWNIKPYLFQTAFKGQKGKRIQSLTLLGYFSDEDSLKLLLKYVDDKDIAIQITALRSLALRRSTKYLKQIIKSLSNSKQTNVILLADVLKRFGDQAVKPLLEVLNSSSNTNVKISIIMALGNIGSLKSVDDLIKFAHSHNVDVCTTSIASLGKIGDHQAAQIIAAKLQHKSEKIRIEAAKSLGSLQVTSTLPLLVERLYDKNWWVRFYAAKSIYKFSDKGIAILKSISNQEDEAGLISAQILGEFMEISKWK